MKKVEGYFDAGKYGRLRFVMVDAFSVTINLGPEITLHGVKYHGTVYGKRDVDSPWREDVQNSYIRRVDGGDINWRSNTVPKLKESLIAAWADQIMDRKAGPLLIMAALAKVEEERQGLLSAVAQAEKLLHQATNALENWDNQRGELLEALRRANVGKIDLGTITAAIVED